MLLNIDKSSSTPVYKRIVEEIKNLINQGTLETGKPLPSSRSLAQKLGVNRSTVYQAYAELQAQGYLQSRPGSYNIVQKRRKEAAYNPKSRSLISWEKASSSEAKRLYETFLCYSPERPKSSKLSDQFISLAALDPDPRLYPLEDFRKCLNTVLLNSGTESLQYGTYKGYRPLCEHIAQRLRLHGISVSDEEILITNGAQQGIDLVARVLGGPNKKAVVESPTYANVIPLLDFNGFKILGVPMKQNGMDLGALEKILDRENVSFVYTIPNFQNPTGITTSHYHREKLLNICLEHRVPIVEDGFEEDMKYFGKVDLPIKSIDDNNIVIYLGTFSKALFPGLRIGWITADKELIQRIAAIKRFADLTSSNLAQIVMHYFCQQGFYDRHLKRLHRVFRRRMQVALKALEKYLPSTVSWTRPVGGYTLWVKMPRKLNEVDLHEQLLAHGVTVSPGGYYFPNQHSSEYFRLSIARLNEQEIEEGIKRLGKALHKLFKPYGPERRA
jgi:GntR family transcriptional regulator/MocR family aminotransferase